MTSMDAGNWYMTALMHARAGRFAEAEGAVRPVLAASPTDLMALIVLGALLERQERLDEALGVYESAIAAHPANAGPFSRRAAIMVRRFWGPPPPPRPADPLRPMVMMSNLGNDGRFGNQLLQYGFVRMYGAEHGLETQVPDWIGRDLFDLDDPMPAAPLPVVQEDQAPLVASLNRAVPEVYSGVDIRGYFCGDTAGLARHRDLFRSLYRPGTRLAPHLERAMGALSAEGRTLVALHLRRGDFGTGMFWRTPASAYLEWLSGIWGSLESPLLYIASDDPTVAAEFAEYQPMTSAALGVEIPGVEFIVDFHVLTRADRVAVSNSTFSFVASMLNERAREFVRPASASGGLVPFDPWAAPVLLRDAAPEPSPAFPPAPPPDQSPESMAIAAALIAPGSTVLVVGAGGEGWSRAVTERHPGTRVLRWEPEAGATGAALDDYCREQGVRHVQFMRVISGQSAASVLAMAPSLLRHARIDYILFGAPFPAEGAATPEDADFLRRAGYEVLGPQAMGQQLSLSPLFPGAPVPAEVLAMHQRLTPLLRPGPKEMLDLSRILPQLGILTRGVIQLGAHVGEELDTWKRLGAQRIVCVEANPAVYQKLLTTIAGARHVVAVNCAASDHVGRITLRVTSGDQSSSILPLARHLDLYPDIVEVSTVEVPCTTVDQLLTDQRLPASAFNVLSIDIQGAELLALRGAERTLPSIEAINLEVNFDELYKGAPQIEEIEEFLGARGFSRAALTCPFHATWGDALYIRTAAAPPPPPLVHPDWLKGWR